MLEWEQYTNRAIIAGVDPERYSGFGFVALARKASELDISENPPNDKGIYFGRGRRQYRLEKKGETITIEGLVLPPDLKDEREPLFMRMNQIVRAMKPITILPNGNLKSGSDYVSPHDKRLTVLVSDLIFPTNVSPGNYNRLKDQVVK